MGLTNAQKRKARKKNGRKLSNKAKAMGMTKRQARDQLELEHLRARFKGSQNTLGDIRATLKSIIERMNGLRGAMVHIISKITDNDPSVKLTMSPDEHKEQLNAEIAKLDHFKENELMSILRKWNELENKTDNIDKLFAEVDVTTELNNVITKLNSTMQESADTLSRLELLQQELDDAENNDTTTEVDAAEQHNLVTGLFEDNEGAPSDDKDITLEEFNDRVSDKLENDELLGAMAHPEDNPIKEGIIEAAPSVTQVEPQFATPIVTTVSSVTSGSNNVVDVPSRPVFTPPES